MANCVCGWVNTWRDSGDRGAAQWDHERTCEAHKKAQEVKEIEDLLTPDPWNPSN